MKNKVNQIEELILKAKNSIIKIAKTELDEIMKYKNPPSRVKLCL